jgi:hypothetical protein
MRVLTSDEVARATAELILALQKEFPGAQLTPCEAIEGEAIHLEVQVAGRPEELKTAQERALELKREVEDRYGLSILVRVVPKS